MKQSVLMSWIESVINILAGFGISLTAQWFFLPLLGVQIHFAQNLMFAVIMTVISLARSFVLRRVFEALHIRRPLSPIMQAAIAERFRQQDVKGYDILHDDSTYEFGELTRAGVSYSLNAANGGLDDGPPRMWPWGERHWKSEGVRDDLVKGIALQLADGELFDRQRKRKDVKTEARAA